MNGITRQAGGFYNTVFLLILIGASALLTLTVVPIYLNESKAAKIVGQVASSSSLYNASIQQIRKTLERRWYIDDVKHLEPKDIDLIKAKSGKSLGYKYEVRSHLFLNWDLVLTFDKTYPMARGS